MTVETSSGPSSRGDDRARAVLARLGLADAGPVSLAAGLSSDAWRIRAAAGEAVLRMPVEPADGVGTYPIEHLLLARLTELGAPVPAPIQGSWLIPGWPLGPFSLTSLVPGIPLRPESMTWAAAQVGRFVGQLHGLPVTGHGPLGELAGALVGTSADAEGGLLAAFADQPLWPFGGTPLTAHPALAERPDLVAAIEVHAPAIRHAALGPPAVIVHSDLHEENILEDGGRLGFIDFGECFAGAAAWEFATLAYFGGWPWADRSLAADPPGPDPSSRAVAVALLALSFGLYRWQQDRRLGVDDEAHDEAFLWATLARLSAG